MKVNMTPNPLDVVTIHASQGDTEARQWEFELHNNGELIDTSEVTEQLFFKAYKGGTEQLLPENTSTPTTSPFKGDIKYPQGLLTDQEFTYRQSPTESDGLAKITDIKGNTLVWNQLIEKGNMTDGWTFSNVTGSYSDNVLTFTASARGGFVRPNNPQSIVANHEYLAMVDVKGTSSFTTTVNFTSRNSISIDVTTNWQTFSLVFTNTIAEKNYFPRIYDYRQSGWDAIQIRNCMMIDLTQMGLDIADPSDFTSLFPLSYYSYNQGSLLSFNGNGIKTVGKNLLNSVRTVGTTYTISGVSIVLREDGSYKLEGTCTGSNVLNLVTLSGVNNGVLFHKGSYVLSGSLDGTSSSNVELQYYIPSIGSGNRSTSPISFTLNELMDVAVRIYVNNGRTYNDVVYPMLRFADTEDSTFEPYTSSIADLPISTYFPSGMKSAGTVYDELTESKAISRIGSVDLGSLNWQLERANYNVFLAGVQSYIKPPINNDTVANIKCALYSSDTNNNVYGYNVDKAISVSSGGALRIRDTSFSDANTFKQSLSGVYLVYPLATPTETSFTTASLVTENAEIPLSNNDGALIGKCTEELSSQPGFIDAKIKLSDADGECYSNKIQLHVERSPQ